MQKQTVLFVCIHNSARSQMAEAFLNRIASDRFEAQSAGLEPGVLNPLAVTVMDEIGIDISNHSTKSVFDLLQQGLQFDYVIAVCDKEAADKCPVFPGAGKRLHWSFKDPSRVEGNPDEKLAQVRKIRGQIQGAIEGWLETVPV